MFIKRKKNCISIGLALFFGLLTMLTGCNSASSSSSITPDATSAPLANHSKETSITSGLHQVGTEGGASMAVSSDNGFYELVPIFPDSYNILYVDYATSQQLYLCGNPNCDHHSESCTSYIDASAGNIPGLLYSDEKIYIIESGAVSEDCLPKIEVMNADGSERKLLKEFKSSQIINAGWYLVDDTFIYYMREDIDSAGEASKTLCRIDKTTGKEEELMHCDYNEWMIDGNGTTIFFKVIEEAEWPDRDLFDSEEAYYEAWASNSSHKIMTYNLENKQEPQVVDEWRQDSRTGNMLDGWMYYYDISENKFVRKDYLTGEVQEVSNTLSRDFETIYVHNIIDDQLIFTSSSSANNVDIDVSMYAVDFSNQTVNELHLMDNNRNRPISVLGVYQDKVYVNYGSETQTVQQEFDGKLQEVTVSLPSLGWITKSDFFAGNPNYTPVEKAY